jgi:hypothetical protein
MHIAEFFQQYSSHDSVITQVQFSPQQQMLTIILDLCNYMQRTFHKGDRETIQGTLTFNGVDQLRTEPDPSILNVKDNVKDGLNDDSDAGILQVTVIPTHAAERLIVKIVLAVTDYKAKREETCVLEFLSSSVDWKPDPAPAE